MDDATLQSLHAALAGSPENAELRRVLVRAHLDRDEPERALALATGDAPETRLLRARALLALDRRKEGLAEYRAAVEANAALEDPSLRDRLAVNVRTFRRPDSDDSENGPAAIKVYSNDDTGDSESRRLLHPAAERVDFGDVGGLDEVKRQIRKRIILPFEKPSLFQRFKKKIGGGILLYGPPGLPT